MNIHEVTQLMDRAIFARFAQLLADRLADGEDIADVPVDEIKYRAEEEVTRLTQTYLNSMINDFGQVNLKDGSRCFSVVSPDGMKTDVWAENSIQARMKAVRSGMTVAGVEAV